MTTQTNNLSERAMLVRLKCHTLGTSRQDKGVTEETTTRKGAAPDAGKWTTHIIPRDSMGAIRKALDRIRAINYTYTLPWLGDGTRILPSRLYDGYMAKAQAAIDDFNQSVVNWLRDEYPQLRESASRRLAGLMTGEIQLPTVEEARRRFSIEHYVFPLPNTNDFRCAIGSDQKKATQDAIDRLVKTSVSDIYKKLGELVERIVKQTAAKKGKIYDSLINNLKELVELIPALNINDDPELEALRKDCADQLASIDPADLRKNKRLRKATADKATHILESIRKIDLDIE
jgi:hypothetical protein